MLKFLSYCLYCTIISGLCYSPLIMAQENSSNPTERTITLKLPPKELAKWYKPANKRQVWLHTMFRLRRELLAMNDYARQNHQAGLEKWSDKFAKDYLSIAQMMPQWEKYLYPEKLEILTKAVKSSQYAEIPAILKKLGKSCRICHDDYQTVATLLFRTPDFSGETVTVKASGEELDYDELMALLSDSLNRVNIAIKDKYFNKAVTALTPVKQYLNDLSSTCSHCHKQDSVPVKRIMSEADSLLPELEQYLNKQDQQQAGGKLGEFAVKVCARCHSVHRLTSDLKSVIE